MCTVLFLIVCLYGLLFCQGEFLITLLYTLAPLLQSVQALMIFSAPFVSAMLGYRAAEMGASAHTRIFALWYRKKKKWYFLAEAILLGVSVLAAACFSLGRGDVVVGMLGWLFLMLSVDVLFFSFHAFEERCAPQAGMLMMRSEMRRAIQRRDMRKVISCYELLFLLMEDTIKTGDPFVIQQGQEALILVVEEVIEEIPQLTLYQDPGVFQGNLIDRIMFLEALTVKRVSLLLRHMMHQYQETGETAYADHVFSMVARLFLTFQTRYSQVGFLLLQSCYNVVIESMKKPHMVVMSENPMSIFAATVSECIKSLISQAKTGGVALTSSVPRLLNLLESLMKELFRFNRSISPALLMQPFAEIGQFLADPEFQNLADRELLLTQLKQTLSQFAVLETLSQRLDIQDSRTDTTSTYKEDMPFQTQPQG